MTLYLLQLLGLKKLLSMILITWLDSIVVTVGYSAEQEAPEFGFITTIITLPNKSYFQLKKYIAFQFNYHFHAFEVIAGDEPPTFVTSTE